MKKRSEIQYLDYGVDGESIFFTVNGERRLQMPMWKWQGLINRDHLRGLIQGAKDPEKDFVGLGVREYVMTARFLKKGLSIDDAAQILKTPEPRLRAFYNYALDKFRSHHAVAEEMQRQAEEGRDYVKTKDKRRGVNPCMGSDAQRYLVDVAKIKGFLKGGLEPWQIAEKLGLDGSDFAEWIKVNQPLLDLLR